MSQESIKEIEKVLDAVDKEFRQLLGNGDIWDTGDTAHTVTKQVLNYSMRSLRTALGKAKEAAS